MNLSSGVKDVVYSGVPLSSASGVLILVHGRGGDPDGMLRLADELKLNNLAYAAPRAGNNTWYPFSFLEPVQRNEPYLSESLGTIKQLTAQMISEGFSSDKLFYLGFSQGACLTLEFAARNPARYGGIFALSGGLIGKEGADFTYQGNFEDTPIFLGCSDIDPHIPLERVKMSERIFKEMNAAVTAKIYHGMGHTINQDEQEFIKNSLDMPD